MTKNGKPFYFLFRRNSNSRIYLLRIELSRSWLQNGALLVSIFVFFSLFAGGIYGVMSGGLLPASELAAIAQQPNAAQTALTSSTGRQNIDYSRPDESDELAFNAGGPFDADELESDNTEIEGLIRSIKATANPAYLPSIWPHAAKINNEYGFRRNPFGGRAYEFHAGMDIDGDRGDIVVAPGNGIVTEAGWKGGYGNMIEIDHGNGLTTRFGHLSKVEVEAGASVSRGEMIGLVGSTGRSTGPHLHYELRVNERPINPRFFLPPEPIELAKTEK